MKDIVFIKEEAYKSLRPEEDKKFRNVVLKAAKTPSLDFSIGEPYQEEEEEDQEEE